MSVNVGIWGKLSRVVILLLLLAAVLAVAVWYWPNIQHNERMRQEIIKLDEQIRVKEEQARRQKATLDALQNDRKTVERLARERLGYARTGEVVIRFEESGVTNLTTNPPPRR